MKGTKTEKDIGTYGLPNKQFQCSKEVAKWGVSL